MLGGRFKREVYFIDPRYEWSIYSGWGVLDFKLPPSQLLIGWEAASDWLEKNLRAVGCSRIHVMNIKILLARGTRVYIFGLGGSGFQTPAKPASDWLESQLLIG